MVHPGWVWERVTAGRSGDEVFRAGGTFCKVTADAAREAATLTWLREEGLPAAEVLDVGPDWLLTREIIGRTGADPWPPHQQLRVVDAIAEVTGRLHALPVGRCPFDRTLAQTVPQVRAAAEAGRVDLDDLDVQRRGSSVGDLLEELARLLPDMQAREIPVVTHGDWCLPNVLLDPDSIEVVGLVDSARAGRADRYVDLALMSRSLSSVELNPQFGSSAAYHFLTRCHHDPADNDKIEFYRLLDEFF